MVNWAGRMAKRGWIGLAMLVCLDGAVARGQAVTAVPKVDVGRLMGAWYEVAAMPNKREKTCIGDTRVLYAPGDKARSFPMVTSCHIKGNNADAWNATVKLDKRESGQMKQSYLWPFSAKYWLLAAGPAYEWALVGSPNHKTLWVLSRTAGMEPEVLAEIKAKAAGEGFDVGKLAMVSQERRRR